MKRFILALLAASALSLGASATAGASAQGNANCVGIGHSQPAPAGAKGAFISGFAQSGGFQNGFEGNIASTC